LKRVHIRKPDRFESRQATADRRARLERQARYVALPAAGSSCRRRTYRRSL